MLVALVWAIAPEREWIAQWVEVARVDHIPLFMKDNLRGHWDGEWRQEYPNQEG